MLKMSRWLSAVEACIIISVFSVADDHSLKRISVGKPTTLICDEKDNTDSQLEIMWTTGENLLVVKLSKGDYVSGSGFENRVRFEKEGSMGRFSLHINPVHFSDTGVYSCYLGTRLLRTWNLTVTASPSNEVKVLEREKVSLPCYGLINRPIINEKLSVQWKRGDQVVLNLTEGSTHHHQDFGFRASVFLNEIRKGDFSMEIKQAKMSDQGVYECFTDNNKGNILNSVTLNVIKVPEHGYRARFLHNEGEDFTFVVPAMNIKILLVGQNKGVYKWVCHIRDMIAKCHEDFRERTVVQPEHGRFTLKDVRKNDEGIYRLMDLTETDTIYEFHLKVNEMPSAGILLIFPILALCFWFIRKKRKRLQQSPV